MAASYTEFDKEALAVFEKYGISISKSAYRDWDRRFASDSIDYKLGVDGDLLFSGTISTDISSEESEVDPFGIGAISTCLKTRELRNYKEQSAKFRRLVGELMALKKAHKLFKGAEKRELVEECEQAANFSVSQTTAMGRDNYQVNIPVLEDNAEKLQAAIEELKVLQAESEKMAEKAAE